MDRRELAEAIVEEARPPEPADRPARWLLPVISVTIALAFGIVVLGRSDLPAIGGEAEQGGPAGVIATRADAAAARQSTVLFAPQLTERRYLPAPLRLPPDVATLVRRSYHTNVTGLISVAQSEQPGVQHVYELADGRRVILVQLPLDAVDVGTLAAYSAEDVVVRGRAASALTSRARGFLTTLTWDEDRAAYRLWSATISIDELLEIAEQLR
ncbi:MAG TPA: hypothetical protein VMJ92_05340 [Candidatus Limnocylindrales bacterium]|nr:hypothetical protein [Candidatus Limnocylindrales bacterium]